MRLGGWCRSTLSDLAFCSDVVR